MYPKIYTLFIPLLADVVQYKYNQTFGRKLAMAGASSGKSEIGMVRQLTIHLGSLTGVYLFV